MKKSKNKTILAVSVVLVLVLICFLAVMVFSVPNGDALSKAMQKDDYVTLTDVNNSTPILGLLLPEGANRSILFTKGVNFDITAISVIYFDDYKSLKNYKANLDESQGNVALSRGKALFIGPKKATKSVRWMLWA